MPRGGWRPGGGRPTKEQQAERARLLAETIAKGPKTTPRAYLQGLLDSPGSTKSEKLKAAELLLKLPPEAAPSITIDRPEQPILVIPHGCQFDVDGVTLIWPETGKPVEPAELQPCEPYLATSALTPSPRHREPEPKPDPAIELEAPAPFEVAEPTPPANVTPLRLRPHERGLSFGARHDPQRTADAQNPFKFKPYSD